MQPYAHCSVIHSGQDLKQPKCPLIEGQIEKIRYIYTTDYYSALGKDEIQPLATM